MGRFVMGVFIILHGLVHLLYFGQSQKLFELQPGMVWPEGSWVFSRIIGYPNRRWLSSMTFILAAVTFIVAALIFVVGGTGLILEQPWWQPVMVGATIFSSTIILIFWDGRRGTFINQGGIGLLINLAILALLLILE